MTKPTHWQDPDHPHLWVSHAWLYPEEGNPFVPVAHRQRYTIPGWQIGSEFVPASEKEAAAFRLEVQQPTR